MSEIERQLSAAVGVAAATASATATASVRRNLSIHFLQAAATLALNTREIEAHNKGTPFNSFFELIMWHASSSIIMSVTALEANVNDILKDHIDDTKKSERLRLQCKDLWDTRNTNILEKYSKVDLILDHKLDKGVYEWENAKLLTKFRNALAHFKPSWSHEKGEYQKLSSKLRSKFHQSAWFTADDDFPLNCFCYDSNKLAIESVISFSRYFSLKTGVDDKFAKHLPTLVLPAA